MSKQHKVKCSSKYFQEIWKGNKKFEMRYNDRKYQVMDQVTLMEITDDTLQITGNEIELIITYIFNDISYLKKDWIIFCFSMVHKTKALNNNSIS